MKARQCGHIRRVSMNPHCTYVARTSWSYTGFHPHVCYNRSSRMAKTEREYRQDIIDVGKLVFQKGWVAANDGNISIRLDQDRILASPTQICKGMMDHDDLIIVDMKGRKTGGKAGGKAKVAMHLTFNGM